MSGGSGVYEIVGVVRYTDFEPSFALPIAIKPGREGYFLQVLEAWSQTIVDMIGVYEQSFEDVTKIEPPLPVAVGGEYMHAFISRSGELYLDTARQLSTVLRIALNDANTPLSVKLTICEQLQEPSLEQTLRESLIENLTQSLGQDAARSYENSTVRGRMWDVLQREAIDQAARTRIRQARSRLTASVAPDGTIEIDLASLSESDLRVSFDDIVRELNRDFRRTGRTSHLPTADLSGIPNLIDPTPETILRAVHSSPRQEERVAILMRALLLYPKEGLQALAAYQDRASFGQAAADMLRTRFQLRAPVTDSRGEGLLAGMIPMLSTAAYPLRRGEFLYYLAVHLADFSLVRQAIAEVARKSTAWSVDRIRADIEGALSARTER